MKEVEEITYLAVAHHGCRYVEKPLFIFGNVEEFQGADLCKLFESAASQLSQERIVVGEESLTECTLDLTFQPW